MPAALQFLHMSKSVHTVQRSPVPGSISTLQKLQVDENAGASGLCRWYRTIMLLCLARRRESNCSTGHGRNAVATHLSEVAHLVLSCQRVAV